MTHEERNPISPSKIALLSGISSSMGYGIHLCFLLIVFFLNGRSTAAFLFPTYLGSVLLGEFLFWTFSSIDIRKPLLENIFKRIKSRPYHILSFLAETSFQWFFLNIAIKAGWNPLHFYLIFLGCKVISGPIQSYLSHFFLSKDTAFIVAIGLQIPCFFLAEPNPDFLLPLIIAFGTLCNAITVSRSQCAAETLSEEKKIPATKLTRSS